MTDKKALLIVAETESIELPVYSGSLGPDVVDIQPLIANQLFTYDPGFAATAACKSNITYIDGEKGVLLHRGYPIEQLAQKTDYLDTCYLLLYGELPTTEEKMHFVHAIKDHTEVHEPTISVFKDFHCDAHPMAIMGSLVNALSALCHDSLNIEDEGHREVTAIRLIAKMPTLAAMSYKFSIAQPFVQPDMTLDYSTNFLHMMFGSPYGQKKVDPVLARAMDRIFLLHADHEQNASTSAVRLTGSTGANPFACIAAGIAALWGSAHGGANEAVLDMLDEIGDEKHIDRFIKRAKDNDDPFRLMGFGHRVYKSFDPRATIMKQSCDEVFAVIGLEDDPQLRIAKRLEKIALEDEYFIERKLYPNVDFYSGILLKALGIPKNMFTVIFATGRAVGWIAHWQEMISSPYRIGRPRQLYTGPKKRDIIAGNKTT